MGIQNVWPLLRGEKAEQEQGLELSRQAFEKNSSSGSYIMELGVALLWLKRYAEAREHFATVMKEKGVRGYENKSERFYGMAGAAKWCLGERREAIAEWVSGLKANYGTLGLMESPLLLYFASVICPDLYEPAAARKLMQEKAQTEFIRSWPGPILQLVLGQLNDGEFLRLCQGRGEHDLRYSMWKAEFYRNLMRFERSKISDYRESLRRLTDLRQPEWQDQNQFLSRIWSGEYFLARFEASGGQS